MFRFKVPASQRRFESGTVINRLGDHELLYQGERVGLINRALSQVVIDDDEDCCIAHRARAEFPHFDVQGSDISASSSPDGAMCPHI